MPKPKEPEFPKLFPKDYWERPPIRNRGDAKADLTYMAVGIAITRWESLEDQFADLFSILLQGQYFAAKQVYGSIQTSHGRREALRHAAESVFRDAQATDRERDTFAQLVHNFGLASNRRDDIAHAIVMGFQVDNDDRGCFLVPPRYNSERNHPLYARPKDDELFSTAKYRYIAADTRNDSDKS